MPDFTLEKLHLGPVAGIDEAGRGPLAGPVVAACVYIPEPFDFLAHVRDSKKLGARRREALFTEITRHCAFGIAIADVGEIDRLNILNASLLAMERAADALKISFNIDLNAVLVDGTQPPKNLPAPLVQTVVGGDDLSYSIACASILAKVTRDRYMREIAPHHPHYGWESNMGYPTPTHLKALKEHGPSPHHRTSFAPVRRAGLR